MMGYGDTSRERPYFAVSLFYFLHKQSSSVILSYAPFAKSNMIKDILIALMHGTNLLIKRRMKKNQKQSVYCVHTLQNI
jgi:hypothetical protein